MYGQMYSGTWQCDRRRLLSVVHEEEGGTEEAAPVSAVCVCGDL